MISYQLLREHDGADLGSFASTRAEWHPGSRIRGWSGEELVVVRTEDSPPEDPLCGYLVVRDACQ
jgi:hypothetical protein